jgi:hypothetical protein
MPNEETKSDQSTPQSKPVQLPLKEGYQPAIKGHQAIEFGQQPDGEMNIRGYSPQALSAGPSTPPQGGSGVPPAKAQVQPSSGSTQQSDKKE